MADAIRSHTLIEIPTSLEVSWVCKWEGLDSDDSGAPLQMPAFSDRSIQFTGTFGAGGTVSLEGSNDGTNYEILQDIEGAAITLTSAGIRSVLELTRYIRPHVTAGDGTTDIDAHLLLSGYRRW